ncbi:MAG TPA: ABC transporter permease [Gemmatimonadaceae bacterium]|nr:ABC transporter permease [Gemmatimonadaceae bacterium]
MKKGRLLKIASQSILKNKMRTLLTMLGIVIGVGAVIIMVAVGHGASSQIEKQINSLGTNLLIVTPGSFSLSGARQGAGSFNRLEVEDYEKLKREATLLAGVSPVIETRTQVIANGTNWRTNINGVSTDYALIRDWQTTSGAFFGENDVRASRKVALLGRTVADNLFPGVDPVGSMVQIGHVPFTVIGVLAPKGQNAGGRDDDDVILMPYTTAQTRVSGWTRLNQILASTYSTEAIPAATREISAIMREAHRLNPSGSQDDFTVRNQTELAAAATSTTSVMTGLLAAIASISLIVGGIGIMNIMLVSVTERTREIGIRMAIGARGSDVLTQFLVESIVMSVLGGVIGLAVGYGGAALLGHLTGWAIATPASAVVLAVGFSAAVGIFFGYYPARKAAALNPIQALRYE